MEEKIRKFFNERFADAVIREDSFRDQQTFYINPDVLIDVCRALLEDNELDMKFLSDITVVDWLGHELEKDGRYEVVYNIYSLTHQYRLLIKVHLPEDNPKVASLCDVWPGANWMEREAFDLFGIEFEGHPNLTKVLTPDELEGHPLRRDFPLTYEQPQFSWNKDDPPEVIK